MTGCVAARCHCCECRGVHCLVGHPGHSHRSDGHLVGPGAFLEAWRRHLEASRTTEDGPEGEASS